MCTIIYGICVHIADPLTPARGLAALAALFAVLPAAFGLAAAAAAIAATAVAATAVAATAVAATAAAGTVALPHVYVVQHGVEVLNLTR